MNYLTNYYKNLSEQLEAKYRRLLNEVESPFRLGLPLSSGGPGDDPNTRYISGVWNPGTIQGSFEDGLAGADITRSLVPASGTIGGYEEFMASQPKTSFWNTTYGQNLLFGNAWIQRCFAYDYYWNSLSWLRTAFNSFINISGLTLQQAQAKIVNFYARTLLNYSDENPGTTVPNDLWKRLQNPHP
jgi:hypothetical protein